MTGGGDAARGAGDAATGGGDVARGSGGDGSRVLGRD